MTYWKLDFIEKLNMNVKLNQGQQLMNDILKVIYPKLYSSPFINKSQ